MLRRLLGSAVGPLVVLASVLPTDMLCHAAARPSRGAGREAAAMDGTRQHTQQPIVTGTSVLGIKYK